MARRETFGNNNKKNGELNKRRCWIFLFIYNSRMEMKVRIINELNTKQIKVPNWYWSKAILVILTNGLDKIKTLVTE